MTKHVTLFGRKMRKCRMTGLSYRLGSWVVVCLSNGRWTAHDDGLITIGKESWKCTTPHAAARALERKIRAAHRRLGKVMAGTKGRSK